MGNPYKNIIKTDLSSKNINFHTKEKYEKKRQTIMSVKIRGSATDKGARYSNNIIGIRNKNRKNTKKLVENKVRRG